jgi:hypothetical protein
MHVRIIGLEAIHISREEEQAPPLKHKSPTKSSTFFVSVTVTSSKYTFQNNIRES